MARKESKTLEELFHDTLKDIYFAEKKILATLPKMEKAAQASELKRAFAKHKTETEGHVGRLEKVFAEIDKKPQTKTCDAIVGITDEGAEIMKEYKSSPALDAGLLAAAQAVEHYEISRYGTLKTWASELGLSNAVGLLDQTLAEEKNTDAALTEIAESRSQKSSFLIVSAVPDWPSLLAAMPVRIDFRELSAEQKYLNRVIHPQQQHNKAACMP